MERVHIQRLILTLLILGAILLGACTSSAPSPAVEKPSPTATVLGNSSTTPTVTGIAAQLQVHFINVGQGDAILIDFGTVEVLIDGGDRSPGVVPYLRKYVDGDLEAMVATHPHADHIGGLIDVLQAFQVDNIYWNGEKADSKTYTDFMTLARAEPGSSLEQLKRGDSLNVSGLTFSVFNPPSSLFADTNDNSIVLKLKHGDIQFLFEGDAQQEAESNMLAAGLHVGADILKVGHHGSRSSSSMPFLKAVSPQIAVYMAGVGNSYGHPHPETIVALNDVGAKIYGTDIHGNIVVTTDGEKYELQLEKQALPVTVANAPTTTPTPTPTPIPTPSPTPEPQNAVNVQITHISYDGQVPRVESDEYVEITNIGTEPVDLAGWVLKDISEGYPSFTFPSYNLQPGTSIRVYTNEIHPEYGGFSFHSGKAVWNNTDPDTVALYNAQGQEVSRKSY